MTVVGLVLAAGAGSRMGRPKALVRRPDGVAWVRAAAEAVRDGGCSPIIVVLGAGRDEALALVPDFADVVDAAGWEEGMGASLRTGLAAARDLGPAADATLIHLVDLPDVGAGVIARLAALAAPTMLARAVYDGRPGHPVLLGRTHWTPVIAGARGDRGARDYLDRPDVTLVECGDLASGTDVDVPPAP
jgi:CTP:molybdopterin cytidylyltransferase MocA